MGELHKNGWEGLWNADFIDGTTINYLPTPEIFGHPLSLTLYACAIVALLAFVIIKKPRTFNSFIRPAAYVFLFIALLFSIKTEYVWFKVFVNDINSLRDKDIEKRVAYFDGSDFFPFVKFMKSKVPEGESFRAVDVSGDETLLQMKQLGQYYLLPRLTSKTGRFIWVYDNGEASYDLDAQVLYAYGQAYRARPYAVYRQGAAVFEIVGQEAGR
ncbi:MAG: hypothetical protein HYS21_13095 [Deltaproteobacteria bacterium]|nr:hypothetical protein [Deltaproteobacteria bacterium]